MGDRHVVIVGFMGCGKTTVAKALARQLGCSVIDLDSFITEREGRSPAEIIQDEGEPLFREIETLALKDALENGDARVIALGGGTWTLEQNRALVAQHNCLSVWLDAPFELCWKRITSVGSTIRPLAPDRASAQQLYESRRTSYDSARLRVDITPETSIAESVAIIADKVSL